jgi:hypothetical protein
LLFYADIYLSAFLTLGSLVVLGVQKRENKRL